MANDAGYEVNKYGFSTRPMSDDQAKSLLDRLAITLADRIELSKNESSHYNWKDNGQRQAYLEKVEPLVKSIANINKLKTNGAYNIATHELSVAPEAIPSGEDPDNPMSIENAKFIIKAIDGIAIINSILSINDIRNIYTGDPDRNLFANGLINNAIRASNKVDETYDGNKDFPWGKLTPPYNKKYTIEYASLRGKGGDRNGTRTRSIIQKRVYPHFTTNSEDPFYTFSGLLYKYINVIYMVAGSDSVNKVQDHLGNYYYNRVSADCHTDEFGFTFDPDFSDTIAYSGTQDQYVRDALNLIAPNNGSNTKISDDVIKYVKDFVMDYIKSNERGVWHQPISAVFDYYVIDYLVQILEAEFELFDELRRVYEWKTLSFNTHTTDILGPNVGQENEYRKVEIQQFNDAPFYYSTCNGASCVGLCYGSCVNTCNGCGGCTGYCSTACGGTCTYECVACTGSCSGECFIECQNKCTTGCDAVCKSGCEHDCSTGCTESCKGNCKNACSGCSSGCLNECQGGCKTNCVGTCGYECSTSSMEITNTVSTDTPKISGGGSGGKVERREMISYQNGREVRIITYDTVAATKPNGERTERVDQNSDGVYINGDNNTQMWRTTSNTGQTSTENRNAVPQLSDLNLVKPV